MSPAPNLADVETGATVSVTFNQAIDPSTLTGSTFTVTVGGTALPTAVTYMAAAQTARATAPLLPDESYQVELTTGVLTAAGVGLGAAEQWSFSTRPWETVTVDAGGSVGAYTSLVLDQSGGVHVTYVDNTNLDLKYATCVADCAMAANWQTVTVDAAGDVGANSSLAIDRNGALHVGYLDNTNDDLKYATCAAACAMAVNWQTVTVDAAGFVGYYTSLTVDGSQGVHVSYHDGSAQDLRYATCPATCETVTNWQTVTVDAPGNVGFYTSPVVDASGQVHLTYQDFTNKDLKYATCAAACATAANWQTVTVDATGDVGYWTSLAIDAGGRLHVSYGDYTDFSNHTVKYATCAAACATAASWQTVTLDASLNLGTSLEVDGSGRIHVSYQARNLDLEYATCAAACSTAANWRFATIEAAGDLGFYSSLAVDGNGRLHVSSQDGYNGDLRYSE